MNLVIDTNRIMASLIIDSTARKILMSPFFNFFTPEFTFNELEKYEGVIRSKGGFSHDDYKTILAILLDSITIVPQAEYRHKISKAQTLIEDSDDVAFIAVTLAKNFHGIWTDDAHFHSTEYYLIFRTKDLVQNLES